MVNERDGQRMNLVENESESRRERRGGTTARIGETLSTKKKLRRARSDQLSYRSHPVKYSCAESNHGPLDW